MPMPSLTILGLDPGSRALGWAVLQVTGPTESLLASGTIRTRKTPTPAERFRLLMEKLCECVTTYQPHLIAYEEYVYFGLDKPVDIQSSWQVNRVIGLILALQLLPSHPRIMALLPQEWGQLLTGQKRHDKQMVAKYAGLRLGIPLQAHEGGHNSDAVGVALVAADRWRYDQHCDQSKRAG